MATYTPPPYFPQGALAPPDKHRYRKFKRIMAAGAIILIAVLAGIGYGVWLILSRLF